MSNQTERPSSVFNVIGHPRLHTYGQVVALLPLIRLTVNCGLALLLSTAAQAADPPTVLTGDAYIRNSPLTTRQLNGSVNPNGAATTGYFEYGLTTAYGTSTAPQVLGSGTSLIAFASVNVSDLTCSTLYHYRAVASNGAGVGVGIDKTFTTFACTPPLVTTTAATSVTLTSATLNAVVNPYFEPTTAFFEYGTSTAYGTSTPSQSLSTEQALGGGAITGLTCGTTYHFRGKATSAGGTGLGSDLTFTTASCPPTLGTVSASGIAAGTALLSGTVVSDGGLTISERGFVYSPTSENSNPLLGGTGVIKILVSGTTGALSAALSSLTASSQYAYKAFATNSLGTSYSSVSTFTTLNPALSINDVSAKEGNALSTILTFTVTLSPQSASQVTVLYATQDGTAAAGSPPQDYVSASGTLTFPPGEVSKTLTVMVVGDIATWLTKTSRQVYVALSTGSGMLAESAWVSSIGTDPTDLLFSGDTNGDGKDDLVAFARKEGKVYVALSDGTKFGAPSVWHGFFAVSTYERPRVADVNGDGKADIVTFATDSPTAFGDVYVATSDGTQFVGPTGAANDSSKWHDFFAIRPTEEIRIGDLNGDGKHDFFTFLPPPFAQCYSVLSQGTSMADNALWAEAVAPLLGQGDNVYVGDVSGDGKADIIIFAQTEGKVYVSLAP